MYAPENIGEIIPLSDERKLLDWVVEFDKGLDDLYPRVDTALLQEFNVSIQKVWDTTPNFVECFFN